VFGKHAQPSAWPELVELRVQYPRKLMVAPGVQADELEGLMVTAPVLHTVQWCGRGGMLTPFGWLTDWHFGVP
jgi:hypothetical protein